MTDEGGQELELEWCERDLGVVEGHRPPREVDRQAIVVIAFLRCGRARGRGSPEQGLDARDELLTAERLDDVVVGARLQTAHSLELSAPRGQHQDRHVADIPDPFERLPAVQVRHPHVENNEGGRGLVEGPETGATIFRLLHGEPGSSEQLGDETADIRVVVDYEHPGGSHTVLIPNPGMFPTLPADTRAVARILTSEPHPDLRVLIEAVVRRTGNEPVGHGELIGEDVPAAMILEPASVGGLAAAARLRRQLEDLPIICASIYPRSKESRALAPVAHLIKPFRLRELEAAIVSALAR